MKQNKGFIDIVSAPDQGTTVRIYWPRYETGEEPAQPEPVVDSEPGGRETILVVEDEASVLRMLRTTLEDFGYTVVTAANPHEAKDTVRSHRKEIDLLLTDVVMPEMNGRDLADELMTMHPGLKCLFMSGYTEDIFGDTGILDKQVNFIQKPFMENELLRHIRKVLDDQPGKKV